MRNPVERKRKPRVPRQSGPSTFEKEGSPDPKALDAEHALPAVAAFISGASIEQIQQQFKVSFESAYAWQRWADEFQAMGMARLEEKAGVSKMAAMERIGQGMAEYLEAKIRALNVQIQQFADPTFLAGLPPAEQLAIHLRLLDSTIRLYEAADRAAERANDIVARRVRDGLPGMPQAILVHGDVDVERGVEEDAADAPASSH